MERSKEFGRLLCLREFWNFEDINVGTFGQRLIGPTKAKEIEEIILIFFNYNLSVFCGYLETILSLRNFGENNWISEDILIHGSLEFTNVLHVFGGFKILRMLDNKCSGDYFIV